MMVVVYLNSNMIYINPLLVVVKIHFYEVETEGGQIYGVMSRDRHLRSDLPIDGHRADNYLILSVTSARPKENEVRTPSERLRGHETENIQILNLSD